MELRGLIGFDVVETIDDAPADLQIPRTLAEPPPTLQGAGADAPAA